MAILIGVTNMYASGGLGATPATPPTQPNQSLFGALPTQDGMPPQDGLPQDALPTQDALPPSGALPPQGGSPRGGRGRNRIAALVVTCAVVAGGGFAVTEVLAGPGHAAGTGASSASGPTGQAAVLSGALADAASATPAATSTPATGKPAKAPGAGRLGRALIRLRRLGGLHGQYTFQTKKGTRTLAFERGTVLSVAGADVSVRATDGTTWTWVLTSTSVVRDDGSRVTAKNVAAGQLVLAAGPVTGSTRDARLLVIRTAAKKQA